MATSHSPAVKTKKTKKMDQLLKYEEQYFVDSSKPVWNYSLFTDEDIRNYQAGTLYNAYTKFGSHQLTVLETGGFYFSVWAPNATAVSVIGDFNGWNPVAHKL